MTTKNQQQTQRKLMVRLSVLVASSLTLAASWLGVSYADSGAQSTSTTAVVPQQQLTAPSTDTATSLVPAPAATRQVVVVRRSRAS